MEVLASGTRETSGTPSNRTTALCRYQTQVRETILRDLCRRLSGGRRAERPVLGFRT